MRTSDAALGEATTWTPERERAFLESKKQLALLEAGDVTKEVERLRLLRQRLQSLTTKADSVATGLGEDVEKSVAQMVNDIIEKQKASEIIAAEASKAEILPDVGTSSAWRALYQAAKDFSINNAYPGKPFPNVEDDALCVLCLQPVQAEAKERFGRFQKFMESTIERELDASKLRVAQIRGKIVRCDVPGVEIYDGVVQDGKHFDGNLVEAVPAYFKIYAERKAQLLVNIDGLSENAVPKIPSDISAAITAVAQAVQDRAEALKEASKPDEIEKLKKHIAEETARRALAQRKADVRARRDGLRLEALYTAAYKALRPTGITVKGRDIVNATLTPALIASLNAELAALNWNRSPIEIKAEGRDGTTRVQFRLGDAKAIGDARLTDVLSEGEQRALAIAGFLAEVEATGNRQPIVFDDPVSSLDHLFIQRVAMRLAKEALERQVIVFTHDLALLVELADAADSLALGGSPVGVQVITVSRMETPGVATVGHPWEGAKTKERANQLLDELAKFKDLQVRNKAEYNSRSACLYARLREAWESLIERDLLGAVVARYRFGVQTQTLWGITVENSDVFRIDAAISKASKFMIGHDTSLHISADRPGPTEATQDIEELRTFANELNKRREEVRGARKKALKPATVLVG